MIPFTIDDLKHWDWNWKTVLTGAAVTVSTLAVLIKTRSASRKAKLRHLWNSRRRDVVTLHMFPRALNCPNISPFVIKLETYLRASGIK